MAARKRKSSHTAGLTITALAAARVAPRASKPAPAAIDVDALFADTMRRFPGTMARLAE